mmetsp:Transcript_34662/g.44221  ORF Transcript_34662/g.44221 Transcript_34662/m.44221 type:complete len:114 (+) Transcript_34662:1121-1462(+)
MEAIGLKFVSEKKDVGAVAVAVETGLEKAGADFVALIGLLQQAVYEKVLVGVGTLETVMAGSGQEDWPALAAPWHWQLRPVYLKVLVGVGTVETVETVMAGSGQGDQPALAAP